MQFAILNMWYWLIPILVCLLGAIVGYLFGKGGRLSTTSMAELEALRELHTRLEIDLAKCREELAASGSPVHSTAIPFDTRAARAAFGKRIRENDLKLVEGIGPKIEGLFHNFDIKTWKALSETSVAKCQEVLDSGGYRYTVHDPASWPMQARMAYEGKWKALARWQEEHKHGKL